MDILFETKRKSGLVLLKLGDNSTPKKTLPKIGAWREKEIAKKWRLQGRANRQ